MAHRPSEREILLRAEQVLTGLLAGEMPEQSVTLELPADIAERIAQIEAERN